MRLHARALLRLRSLERSDLLVALAQLAVVLLAFVVDGHGLDGLVDDGIQARDLQERPARGLAADVDVQRGEDKGGEERHQRDDDERDHGLGTAQSAIVGGAILLGVLQPKVCERPALVDVARDRVRRRPHAVDLAVDEHGGDARAGAEEGADLGRRGNVEAAELKIFGNDPREQRPHGSRADEVGDEEERHDLEAVRGLDDGGDIEAHDHQARPVRGELVVEQVLGQNAANTVLQRIQRRRGEHGQQREGDVVPEARQRLEEVEEGEVRELVVGLIRRPVVRIGDHAHYAEEHHHKEDHDCANYKADAHIPVALRRPDALPVALVEEPRRSDGDPQADQSFEAFGEPSRGLVELVFRDLVGLQSDA
mmetsp:Transcript_17493/g.62206  ORF Transcript_17493/g.62206 Transcript_17493/m.62206 type:complete len:367 (-) Transcript_17493:869-1969(-)